MTVRFDAASFLWLLLSAALLGVALGVGGCSTPNEDPSDYFRRMERWSPLAPSERVPL